MVIFVHMRHFDFDFLFFFLNFLSVFFGHGFPNSLKAQFRSSLLFSL